MQLGLQESVEKATLPATVVIWVGVTFNSQYMTMSIPRTKITQMQAELAVWLKVSSGGKALL